MKDLRLVVLALVKLVILLDYMLYLLPLLNRNLYHKTRKPDFLTRIENFYSARCYISLLSAEIKLRKRTKIFVEINIKYI